ncbi:hypothetical protein GYMLUDRAFT_243492 [Collybiopsis luxurians FD-317 M1]|uniref:Methyltransferase domain-containing protein n=1 Tax=Collybiopsis luxurians FD-317 M1 TaxID=944289 RepID=A0A0D0CY86_9AGAR|nr:hypothetical protein GYMLUDRAFT_243492 [Collybiopsis luxurians FD-317 M1]
MADHNQQRYHASEQYLLPADEVETERLNLQHRIIIRSFEDQLSLASLHLTSGNRVLESAAGTGIWALEFFEEQKKTGTTLDMECIDISDKQFPKSYPPNIHFSLHSVTDLPVEWSGTFLYAHQRLLVAALTDPLWRNAISELFRVLVPGGWIELVELEIKDAHFDVGPSSTKLQAALVSLIEKKNIIGNLGAYLPHLLREIGFVDVQCEIRHSPIGQPEEKHLGFTGDEWADAWGTFKQRIVDLGLIESGEEYERLRSEGAVEWNTSSNKAYVTYYTIFGRKPCSL